jgi:hypothetical protein
MRNLLVRWSLLGVLVVFGAACSDDHDHGEDTCGEHGHLHGDHCDCDEGYVEADLVCVPDCGGFGDWHDDHCDCDEGYVEEGDTCVPDCGGFGDWHDDHCDCDEGYVEEGDTCVPEA